MINQIPTVLAQVAVQLTPEQRQDLSEMISVWRKEAGIVIASLNKLEDDPINITFRQVPIEIGNQIIQIVENYYSGEKTDAD